MSSRIDTNTLHSLLAREQRAPRYTSYPTAMEFTPQFGIDDFRQALARTNDEPTPAPLSLYLHFPFCASNCFYCGCHRVVSRNGDVHARYLDALKAEIALQAALVAPDRPVKQIHFGGGTPNLLRPRQLGALLNQITRHFSLDEDCEISIEVDPRQYRPRDAQAWALLGFNRISLGIQDVDPRVQKLINRRQPVATVSALVSEARRAGIESINFDLIYGLPGQSPQSFDKTLDFVLQEQPERIAVFHYAHMPARFPAQRAINETLLPTLDSAFEIQAHARQRLTNAGYRHIGLDHYALPQDSLARAKQDGRLKRNFQGYTVLGDCDLLGFGVSAISRLGNAFAQNITDTEAYQQRLETQGLAITRGLVQSRDDQIRAEMIESIMCQGEIDMAAVEMRWQLNFRESFSDALQNLERLNPEGNWYRIDGANLKVTTQGNEFLRLIAQCFDAYAAQRRHRGAAEKPLLRLEQLSNG